ncbi:IS3 family transposase [Natranaerobius trueperi]|uniref:IS3 family transposase n=1 Tax=Natranaerobius trueperi TaxID=759412 RepID=A0A226BX02_9FIRM|nr:IS3 family transposase [Natranaerobius trueperi]OWZ82637.1 IS3 family transposase [Natranaerobius trueperi]
MGKNYSDDFKKTVVDLYHSGTSVKDLSSEYGVTEVTIYKWIKQLTPIQSGDDEVTPKDIDEMKKEMQRIKQENENLKKGYGHIREKVDDSELIEFIEEHKDDHSITTMCDALGVSKSTYYHKSNHVESNRDKENRKLTEEIIKIHNDSNKRYGAPKIHAILKIKGYKVSLKRVQRIMKKAGIRSIVRKKFKPYPNKQKVVERENILKQDFSTKTINEKWVTDITYIKTIKDSWCYLGSVMDLHTHKIIGYSISKNMTTDLVIKALKNAYETQKPGKGLILHSDLGTQYTSDEFKQFTKTKGIIQSFSRKGCPYDNAHIESFHATLKKEEVNHVRYLDFDSAKVAIFKFIEGWYNRKRIHGSLGFLTPQAFEDLSKQSA